MTPAELGERWTDLASARRSSRGIERRRLDAAAAVDVFACIFWPHGRAGLLIEGDGRASDLADRVPRCRGVRVVVEESSGDATPQRTNLVIMLEQERLREIFGVLSADLVNAIISEPSGPAALRRCIDRLCMWQGLFERLAPDGLSEERQRGLFGELYILDQLFIGGEDVLAGVDAWVGAESSHQDFRRGGLAVEVKTSLSKRHSRITIASEKQLDERPHVHLLLAHVRLDESEGLGISLPDLVANVRNTLSGDESASRLFDERLLLADYLDVHAPQYETRYRPASVRYFRVEGDFPRLAEWNLPPGVGDIRYTIIADELGTWEMDATSVAALVGETM